MEMNEDWASRRWLAEESIAKAVEGQSCKPPALDYAGGAEVHARRIVEPVMADNPIGRRAPRCWARISDRFWTPTPTFGTLGGADE